METGIVSYGNYIPRHRLNVKDIFDVWRNVTPEIFDKMSLMERAVLLPDEDSITLGVAAAESALERSGIDRSKIGALVFGTCTNPFDTKASATVIQDALGLNFNIITLDVQCGTKSGTTAIITANALVKSGQCDYALAVTADTLNRHFPPGTQMEYSASAGGFAALIGRENLIARFEGFSSCSSDLTDYFRLEGDRYIQLGGGWIGYISNWGLLEHCVPAANELIGKLKLDTKNDFHCVSLHQGTGIQTLMVSGTIGFDMFQVMQYVLTPYVGNCGSASSLLPLAKFLDYASTDERAFVCSYGYGAGADCISLVTTKLAEEKQPKDNATVESQIENKILLDYATAVKYEYKYIRSPNMLTNYL